MARPDNFDVDEFVHDIIGTCKTVDQILDQTHEGMTEDDLTTEDHAHIDQEIFNCACCNWWCEQSEANESDEYGDDICNDCHEEEEYNKEEE